jgi:hypothetical protein
MVEGAPAATAPAQFGVGDWSVSTQTGVSGGVTITVSALPANGGSAITALEYDVGASGTWVALTGTGTGARTVNVGTTAEVSIRLRAVNAVGAGVASAGKSVTPGVAAGPLIDEAFDGSGPVDQLGSLSTDNIGGGLTRLGDGTARNADTNSLASVGTTSPPTATGASFGERVTLPSAWAQIETTFRLGNGQIGAVFVAWVDTNNYTLVRFRDTGVQLVRVVQVVAGVATNLVGSDITSGWTSATPGNPTVLTVERSANNLTSIRVNGSANLLGSAVTMTAHTSALGVGVGTQANSATALVDRFVVT